MKGKFEKHVFISDHQIPDHNEKAINAVNQFIKDFKPDKVHIVGDFLNFTKVAKYDQDPYYHKTMADEINMGRIILDDLVRVTRKANKEAEIIWYEGNHEVRLVKYLGRNATALAEITDVNGEIVNSIPHLFSLKEKGVTWIPYLQRHTERGVEIEHGDVARTRSGMTANAMIDRRGRSGFSGHTHRLAFVMKTQVDKEMFWIETGSLCKREFESPYGRSMDWQNGFAVGIYSFETKTFYPQAIPLFNNTFMFDGKVYTP